MDRNRNRGLIPSSLVQFPALFSSTFPSLWENWEERMNQWFGGNTGVSVSEDDKNVYVESHLPGLNAEDIDISLDRNTLRIRGEKKEEDRDADKRFYRQAQRSFFYQVELPAQVEEGSEQAQYEDGVLKLTFKKTRRDAVKKIPVRGGLQRTNAQQQQQRTNAQQQQQRTNAQQQQQRTNAQQQQQQFRGETQQQQRNNIQQQQQQQPKTGSKKRKK